MRARQRHFNARSAGASLVLDSRYINQADNTEVSSWTDRSANNFTIEQTVSASRPTFQAGEVASNGVVRFDGSNDFLNGGDILDIGTNNLIFICVAKYASSSGDGSIAGKSRAAVGDGRYTLLRESGNIIALLQLGGSSLNASKANTSTAWQIATQAVVRSTENRLFINGTSEAVVSINNTTSYNTTDSFFVGAYQSSTGTTPPTAGLYFNGDLAQVTVLFQSTFSIPVRKRLEQSAAYSFKIACS